MAVTLACEAEWLVHAAVARAAAAYYVGQFDPASLFNVDFLALSYMVVFLVACLPASWVLERWGLGAGVGIGAALTIAGAVGKAVFAASFAGQIGFQLVLAVAQPFLINAATTLARDWFPPNERATAAGLASLAQYLGFVAALLVAPALVQADPQKAAYGSGMDTALTVFAGLSLVAGVFSLVVVRRGPLREALGPSGAFFPSIGLLWKSRDFRLTLLLFFLGLGMLNAVTSLTDTIAGSLGVVDSDGLLGVGLIVGGIVGAIVIPILSDRLRRRKSFLVFCVALAVPALLALVLAPQGWYIFGIGAMAVLGLALMSAGPIGFQYAAETTAPVPESVSQGLLLLVGQVSGLVFTAGMSLGGPQVMRWWLGGFTVLMAVMALLTLRLKESQIAVMT
jgi:MFS family permease